MPWIVCIHHKPRGMIMTGNKENPKQHGSPYFISPWLLAGAIAILASITVYSAFSTIHLQRENTRQLLLEKGAALMRSFEAGTRAGMSSMRWGSGQLQRLLVETARQPDIAHLIITDMKGNIVGHNDQKMLGTTYGRPIDYTAVWTSDQLHHRTVSGDDGERVFEIYRRFSPLPRGIHRQTLNSDLSDLSSDIENRLIVFVGFNTQSTDAVMDDVRRNAVITAVILFTAGLAGFFLLMMAYSYRRVRQSLARIETFSETLVRTMPIGLIVMTEDGTISTLNRRAEELLHCTEIDTVGRQSADVLDPALMAFLSKSPTSAVRSGEVDYPLREGNLRPFDVITYATPDWDNDVPPERIVLIRDLTEIKKLMEEIERSRRLASIGQLAAGVAHEIRNPLSSIKGFATYFLERHRTVPEDRKIAETMIQEVDRLNRVISELLEFARPRVISIRPVSIRPVVDHAVTLIRDRAEENHVEIVVAVDPGHDSAFCDPDALQQVLINLLINAIDAMIDGGLLSVTVTHDDEDNAAIITVSDTGMGIEEENKDTIFDPYYTTKPAGTGLGLAIVHRIIEAHGGNLSVSSTPGKGTSMTIHLPADREHTASQET